MDGAGPSTVLQAGPKYGPCPANEFGSISITLGLQGYWYSETIYTCISVYIYILHSILYTCVFACINNIYICKIYIYIHTHTYDNHQKKNTNYFFYCFGGCYKSGSPNFDSQIDWQGSSARSANICQDALLFKSKDLEMSLEDLTQWLQEGPLPIANWFRNPIHIHQLYIMLSLP